MKDAPLWAWVVAGLLSLSGLLFFLQTKDPMTLIFGLAISAVLLALTSSSGRPGAVPASAIRVKCRQCGALNLEDAKFCSACGRPM